MNPQKQNGRTLELVHPVRQQVRKNKGEMHPRDAARVVRQFEEFSDSVETVARREKLARLDVQGALRMELRNRRPSSPPLLRRAA
jgi:hypothetical protein